MVDFDIKYAEYLSFFNDSLNKRLSLIDSATAPNTIKKAMHKLEFIGECKGALPP